MLDIQTLKNRIDSNLESVIHALGQLVAIPSISSDPARSDEMIQSAEAVRDAFALLGFTVQICSANSEDGVQGQPAVLATKFVHSDAPTVLLYAHHDVQPVGDVSGWATSPFEMTQKDDRLFGRGVADDGAGIAVHLGAVAALGNDLPVNLVVFIEGEEEIGSPTFTAFLAKYRKQLAADVIIVADSGNWDVNTPALTSSLRGVCSCDVKIEVLKHSVHSGMFGGPILDAVTLSSRLIATLHDDLGDVVVAGLGGSDQADVTYPESDLRRDASVVDGYQLAGTGDLAARLWTKPAISVIGFDARTVDRSSNTIAADCRFRLSLRIVPGRDPQECLQALIRHLEKNRPFGAKMTIIQGEMGPGFESDLTTSKAKLLRQALKDAWGAEPVSIGVGGSIPFIADFQTAFPSAEVMVTGVEDPQSNAHSEDESLSITVLRNATLAEALFIQSLVADTHPKNDDRQQTTK